MRRTAPCRIRPACLRFSRRCGSAPPRRWGRCCSWCTSGRARRSTAAWFSTRSKKAGHPLLSVLFRCFFTTVRAVRVFFYYYYYFASHNSKRSTSGGRRVAELWDMDRHRLMETLLHHTYDFLDLRRVFCVVLPWMKKSVSAGRAEASREDRSPRPRLNDSFKFPMPPLWGVDSFGQASLFPSFEGLLFVGPVSRWIYGMGRMGINTAVTSRSRVRVCVLRRRRPNPNHTYSISS